MDMFEYFNSPDTAKHCRLVNKSLNALEAAVMVYFSVNHTLVQKLDTYRAIIEEYPDMSVPKSIHHEQADSFHKVLADIIIAETKQLDAFLSEDTSAVYTVDIHFKDRDVLTLDNVFASFDRAVAFLPESYHYTSEVSSYEINRILLNGGKVMAARFQASGEILEICTYEKTTPSVDSDLLCFLQDFYIDIPTPFKKGDLVQCDACSSYMGNVFAIKDVTYNNPEKHARNLMRADSSDMTAQVFYEADGEIHCDCIHFWPDLRYYRGELAGTARILKYVSHYLKDEICLCTLLKAHTLIHNEEGVKSIAQDSDFQWDMDLIAAADAKRLNR
ncbi:hypothetical protein LJB76_01550 [Clostridia bacterium OttesenSCG-928-O13]|nr:hypothetical protein [Clostridia bacterium OttesenSCG-928-O13]